MKKALTRMVVFLIVIACVWTVTVADSADNTNVYSRIVVFPLYAEEILLSLVSPDRIIYVGHAFFDNADSYSPTMSLTKGIHGAMWQNTDEEEIISLHPDLIILPGELANDYEEIFPELYDSGIPVVFVPYPENINDIRNNITIIGQAVCETEKADQLIRHMNDALKKYETVEIDSSIKILYYDHWQEAFSIVTQTLDVQNLYETEDYVELNDDEIAAWDPDIIMYNPACVDTDGTLLGFSDQYSLINENEIISNPALANTSAVKNEQVYPICLHESHFVTDNIRDLAILLQHYDMAINKEDEKNGTVNTSQERAVSGSTSDQNEFESLSQENTVLKSIQDQLHNIKISMGLSSLQKSINSTVYVLITVTNTGNNALTYPIYVADEQMMPIEGFDQTVLAAGETYQWEGMWTVTQEQIDIGRIAFLLVMEGIGKDGTTPEKGAIRFSKSILY